MLRKLKPEVFQGNLKGHTYFEGWYHKHVSADRSQAMACIPGVSLFKGNRHSFIQFIDGVTGTTEYFTFPLEEFTWDRRQHLVTIGPNRFSRDGIELDLTSEKLTIQGKLQYQDTTPWSGNLISPGIMGWYSWVPFMECYHGVVSMDHGVNGSLTVNGQDMNFDNGRGYIEKDWGSSFPETWIWMQCNSFTRAGTSVMFSVAKIPWMSNFFMGFLAFLYHQGEVYLFATYNNSTLEMVEFTGDLLTITMSNTTHRLTIRAQPKGTGLLKAPETGGMNRVIKESISSEIELILETSKGERIIHDRGSRAGLEIIDSVFDYLDKVQVKR